MIGFAVAASPCYLPRHHHYHRGAAVAVNAWTGPAPLAPVDREGDGLLHTPRQGILETYPWEQQDIAGPLRSRTDSTCEWMVADRYTKNSMEHGRGVWEHCMAVDFDDDDEPVLSLGTPGTSSTHFRRGKGAV